jgi:hypothetical protein
MATSAGGGDGGSGGAGRQPSEPTGGASKFFYDLLGPAAFGLPTNDDE